MDKTNLVLKEVLEKVKVPDEDLKFINEKVKEFLQKLERELKTASVNADVFVGGSFAKKTMIKKDYYDIDVFVRFDKKYPDKELSRLTEKVIRKTGKFSIIHGSRDYFRMKINNDFLIEVIPVRKIKTPKEAENVTDLSYSHVSYIKRKIKTKRILDEIMLAKAFCYANKCYGAESYVQGFSGYALELLIYYYGSFLKFIKEMLKNKGEKIIIDIEKKFRNRQEVLINMNSSKLQSPVVLIDPTYKQRNVLAALSDETFKKFGGACRKFLKTPSIKSFEIEETDLKKIKENAEKNKQEFILMEAKTDRQEGDIAGSKLLKFYRFLEGEISKFFEIKKKGFNYSGGKSARFFFVAKSKREILVHGPNIKDSGNVLAFKKKHRGIFIKGDRVFAKDKVNFSVEKFIEKWKMENKRKMGDMNVVELKII